MENKSTPFVACVIPAMLAVTLVFGVTAPAQTYKVIHNFGGTVQGPVPDGASPYAGLIFDSQGKLYGTTQHGGLRSCEEHGCGTIFQLTPNGDGTWTENVLTGFQTQNPDGGYPDAPVIFDRTGNLFSPYSCTFDCFSDQGGGVLELIRGSNGTWTNVNVVSYWSGMFGGACMDGVCTLTFDSRGHLYLASQQGAFGNNLYGGVAELGRQSVFGWYSLALYGFSGGTDGGKPTLGLIADAGGHLYGTTTAGGVNNMGVVYELTQNQGGPGWRETVLHTFQGGSDGAYPAAGVTFDSGGNLYGATLAGGTAAMGTIYELTPNSNGTWSETVLYSFQGGSDALRPNSTVSFDSAGKLYGTAAGGANNQGAVFKLTPSGGGHWTETVVYSFMGGADGYDPNGGVAIDAAGDLFGTAAFGGSHPNCADEPFCGGVAYEITP